MIKGFREFILRGNVVELAVAVVIAGAFGKVVATFTDQILQPFINAVGGGTFGFGFTLRHGKPATFVNIGALVTAIFYFLIVAAVIYFLVIQPLNVIAERRRRGEAVTEAPEATPQDVLLLQEIRDLLRAQGGPGPRA